MYNGFSGGKSKTLSAIAKMTDAVFSCQGWPQQNGHNATHILINCAISHKNRHSCAKFRIKIANFALVLFGNKFL